MARARNGLRPRRSGYLRELHDDLKDGSYRPNPVKRVEIPKDDGRTRPLGIPTVKDRIVQTALKLTIEPIPRVRPQAARGQALKCSSGREATASDRGAQLGCMNNFLTIH